MAVQLYTHSDYSFLESVCKVEDLVKRAAKLGIKALALTDRGTTAGHGELEHYCRKEGIKPIFGVELDVQDVGEVVLLALTMAGYVNLLHLTSLPKPVPRSDLAGRKADLALLSKEQHTWLEREFGSNYYIRHELGQSLDHFEVFPPEKFVLCQEVCYFEQGSLLTLEILGKIKGDERTLPAYPLLSWEDLCREFAGPEIVVRNTLDLAQRCQDIQLPKEQTLPPDPEGGSLEDLVWQGAKERFGDLDQPVCERLSHELAVIKDLGFEDYFLIVADIVRFAKGAAIPVGPGRGSAASSLVAYCLGITEIDSLRWGLLFERFLNAERNKRPDIDLDFCYERRGEVLSYLVSRFGRDHVAQIGTYGTFGPKGAAQAVKAVLGQENVAVTREIQGLKRHRSTHAAGVIVTARPIQEISAVYLDRDLPVTHLDMYALEDLGVLKIDLLGLRTLTVLRQMEELVKSVEAGFSLQEIPIQDEKTFAMLSAGHSLGIFQLESEFFQDLLKRLKPRSFEDIVALLALGRPGPLGMFPDYVARRDAARTIRYPHPALAEILGETHGLILYQEQVMLIAHRIAGLSLGEADGLRSALAKNDPQATGRWRERFIVGSQSRTGLSSSEADSLFSKVAEFSGYAFNKAHSVSYARITWQAAYLKTHYPGAFFVTLLNQGSSTQESRLIVREAQALGLRILPPSVVHSTIGAVWEGEQLRLGLLTHGLVAPRSAQTIFQRRRNWSSLAQFREATGLDEVTLENLILSGALDDLAGRNTHLEELGREPKRELELLHLEKERLGVYASMHPCSPFIPLINNLKGELDVVAGEIVESRSIKGMRHGVLDTPEGCRQFQGPEACFAPLSLGVGSRVALFGTPEVAWTFPLGPTLLITPSPDHLDTIKT
ncbi:MAG: PHP domain-containing protein, partial [Limnochordia bacterium]|nr:PHP domain-containing protein [Limnochordia bacterium]